MRTHESVDKPTTKRGKSENDLNERLHTSLAGLTMLAFPPLMLVWTGLLSLFHPVFESTNYLAEFLVIGVGCAMLAGVWWLLKETLKRHTASRDDSTSSLFEPTSVGQLYTDRLRRYLDEEVTAEKYAKTGSESSMSFFMAILPDRRRGPKPPGFFREILWRIHRLLSGDS